MNLDTEGACGSHLRAFISWGKPCGDAEGMMSAMRCLRNILRNILNNILWNIRSSKHDTLDQTGDSKKNQVRWNPVDVPPQPGFVVFFRSEVACYIERFY